MTHAYPTRLSADLRNDITFVLCGSGPTRPELEARAAGLTNIQFHDLQPQEEFQELLGLATVHLLPQRAGAADLVLPSKLANMLASRSEEHTSELQSLMRISYAVFCLKKKNK